MKTTHAQDQDQDLRKTMTNAQDQGPTSEKTGVYPDINEDFRARRTQRLGALSRSCASPDGFTLIELMITVAIVSIIAFIGFVGYTRYLRKSMLVEAHEMLAKIQLAEQGFQETNGSYLYVSKGCGNFHPRLSEGEEPLAKTWNPAGEGLTEWDNLGVKPQGNRAYFEYVVVAGVAPICDSLTLNIPNNGQPWFYVRARGDLDGDSTTGYTEFSVTSYNPNIVVSNEGS